MDDLMSAATRPRWPRARSLAAFWLSLACATAPAMARQALPDPTRPPPEASLVPGAAMAMPSGGGPRLQSVLVSSKPGGRRLAVIDGQTVRLGAKFDGAVLVKVTDTEVVLRRGKELQVLTLFPKADLDAYPAAATAPVATAPTPPPVSNHRSDQ